MKDTENKLFLVTGATGTIGRQVVKELLEKGQKVRVLSRDSAKSRFSSEIEVVDGDLTKIETLSNVFNDIYAAHLISIGDENYTPLANGKSIVELAENQGLSG